MLHTSILGGDMESKGDRATLCSRRGCTTSQPLWECGHVAPPPAHIPCLNSNCRDTPELMEQGSGPMPIQQIIESGWERFDPLHNRAWAPSAGRAVDRDGTCRPQAIVRPACCVPATVRHGGRHKPG